MDLELLQEDAEHGVDEVAVNLLFAAEDAGVEHDVLFVVDVVLACLVLLVVAVERLEQLLGTTRMRIIA